MKLVSDFDIENILENLLNTAESSNIEAKQDELRGMIINNTLVYLTDSKYPLNTRK